MTLIETELFRSVEMSELIGLQWTKKGKEHSARHVLALVHRFNNVSNWVIRTIVETPNLQERGDVVMYFFEVLRELRALNNFNGVMELVSALQNATITRLKFTFAELSSKRLKLLEECAAQMSQERNFKTIRAELANVEGPCVPFFGMYLSDMVFIEESNSDALPSGSGGDGGAQLINFGKRRMLAKTTSEIQVLQSRPYTLSVQPEIRAFILDFPSHSVHTSITLPSATATKAEQETFTDEAYDKSRAIEPRDVEDKADLPAGVRIFDGKPAK